MMKKECINPREEVTWIAQNVRAVQALSTEAKHILALFYKARQLTQCPLVGSMINAVDLTQDELLTELR